MQYLTGHGMLHQLMFSTVLLHWSLYAPVPPSQRVTLARWLSLNSGIEGPDTGVMASAIQNVLCLVYNLVSRCFVPQLQIWSGDSSQPSSKSAFDSFGSKPSPLGSSRASRLPKKGEKETVDEESSTDGWGRLVGGGFPSMTGSSGTVTYQHIRSIHSETPSTAWSAMASPENSRSDAVDGMVGVAGRQSAGYGKPLPPPTREKSSGLGSSMGNITDPREMVAGSDRVWLTMRHTLLLLAAKSHTWASYAFVHLDNVVITHSDQASLTLTLAACKDPVGKNDASEGKLPNGGSNLPSSTSAAHDGVSSNEAGVQVQLVFLLPDGRWQVFEIPFLKVQLADSAEFERWTAAVVAHVHSRK